MNVMGVLFLIEILSSSGNETEESGFTDSQRHTYLFLTQLRSVLFNTILFYLKT